MGVLHQRLLALRALHLRLVLVGDGGGSQPQGMPPVDDVVQDVGYRRPRPAAGLAGIQSAEGRPCLAEVIVGGVEHLLRCQLPGNLAGAFPGGAEGEDPLYHRGGHLIRDDLL